MCAGVAKADITDYAAGSGNDPLDDKTMLLKDEVNTAVMIIVDAVASARKSESSILLRVLRG
jgi:hypothetical protein